MNVTTIAAAVNKEGWEFSYIGTYWGYTNVLFGETLSNQSDETGDGGFMLFTSDWDKLKGQYHISYLVYDEKTDSYPVDAIYLISTGNPKDEDTMNKVTSKVIQVFNTCFRPVDPGIIQLELELV